MRLPVALTIAGSDSGGGAGIQADLKTFAALGVHGTSAITAITAQNTVTVREVFELPLGLIRAQIDCVLEDLPPAAAKTGMLSSAGVIELVAEAVAAHGIQVLVVDPVMVAKGGARLLGEDAIATLRERLLPLAAVLTPNLPEAEALLGRPVRKLSEREQAARDLCAMGPAVVVIKGGHADADATDLYCAGGDVVPMPAERADTRNTHGSGCVFSAAIAAGLARGLAPLDAVLEAKDFITGAIQSSLDIGSGHGPVNPAWRSPG